MLLKIKACGICSSDIDRVFKTGTYSFPTIPGHEFSGEIVALGEDVEKSLSISVQLFFHFYPASNALRVLLGSMLDVSIITILVLVVMVRLQNILQFQFGI